MPKRTTPLTDVQVKNSKPKDKTWTLADGSSLYWEITASGKKSWRMAYRRPVTRTNNCLSAWSESIAKGTINRLEKDIFPEIGKLPITEITHKQMIAALRKVAERGAGEVAHWLKSTCARVFSYANQHGIDNKNPAAGLKVVLKPVKTGHFATIAPDELPAFLCGIFIQIVVSQ